MKKILQTPIKDEDLEALNIGDVVYLTGTLVTCRDVAHRRLIELGRELPVDLKGGAIFHAGPIVRQKEDGEYEMVSIGPTTSMRMEKFEKEFIKQTGVKLIVGKGGMREGSAAAFQEIGGVYLAIIGGTAALETTWIEQIEDVDMDDLNPESLWRFKIKDFGPLLVAMDSHGGSIYQEVKGDVARNKEAVLKSLGITS